MIENYHLDLERKENDDRVVYYGHLCDKHDKW
jgi:hypothetical protein